MKTLTMLMILIAFVAKAQDNKYESAIYRGKELIAKAEDKDGYLSAANYFQRVAQKETEEWLPLYYQAQSLALIGSELADADEKEEVLNNALEVLAKAKKIEKNAELTTLEGFVQMLRLTVDPATRGQTLTPTIMGLYNEALALEPKNPRTLLFLGQMEYGTAQFFGKGFEEACAHIQQANDIFEQQPEEDTVYPDWGKESATAMMATCNERNQE